MPSLVREIGQVFVLLTCHMQPLGLEKSFKVGYDLLSAIVHPLCSTPRPFLVSLINQRQYRSPTDFNALLPTRLPKAFPVSLSVRNGRVVCFPSVREAPGATSFISVNDSGYLNI